MTNSVSVWTVNNSYNARSDFIFGEPVYKGNVTIELKRRNDGRRKKMVTLFTPSNIYHKYFKII